MAVIELNANNFDEIVINATKPVLIDFWASWCGPCKMLSPLVEQIAEERDDIIVASINVDEEPELSLQFNIRSIPTLIVFKNGEIANQSIGFIPKEKILALVE